MLLIIVEYRERRSAKLFNDQSKAVKKWKTVEPCSTTRLDILVIPSLYFSIAHRNSSSSTGNRVLDDDLMGRGAKDERLSRLRDVTMPIVTVYVFSRVRFAIGMANGREWTDFSFSFLKFFLSVEFRIC